MTTKTVTVDLSSLSNIDKAKIVVKHSLSQLDKQSLGTLAYNLLSRKVRVTGNNFYYRGAYCPASLASTIDLKPKNVQGVNSKAYSIYCTLCDVASMYCSSLGIPYYSFQHALSELNGNEIKQCLIEVVKERLGKKG